MATRALVEPAQASSPVHLSTATAALADGDDVHARFVDTLRAQGNEGTEPGVSSTPEACIESVADPAYAHVDTDSSILAENRRGRCGSASE
jgi:hypothetical protein